MSKGNGIEPRFDFSQVSRRWSKRFIETMTGVSEVTLALEDSADDARRQVELLRNIQQLSEEQEALLCAVLVDVPRDWLTKDAPAEIDWSDVTSLDYVLDVKSAALFQALQIARQGQSKN